MPVFIQLILCSLVGGAFSLFGGVLMTLSKRARTFSGHATAFAAGALLAAAFVDLLPEAVELSDAEPTLIFTMVGLILFFLLEGGINWFHSHAHGDEDGPEHSHDGHSHGDGHGHAGPHDEHAAEGEGEGGEDGSGQPIIAMVILGGVLHHVIDGVAIAAGFLIAPASGIIVTLAIGAHEIPHRIGDFGVMLHYGMGRTQTIIVNLLSALATTLAAVSFYLLGNVSEVAMAPLLGLVAGFFIYIAATDIIPTIHRERDRRMVFTKSLWLIAGVVVVSAAILLLHGMVSAAKLG
jgi:zinc and cadmium transporter